MKHSQYQAWSTHCFKLWLSCFLIIIFTQCLMAQEKVTELANEAYQSGRFYEALAILDTAAEADLEVHRIRAFAYIALGSIPEARLEVSRLLEELPNYYVRKNDPLLFQQVVGEVRDGLTVNTISSVSKTSEKLSEAPATVMVITAEDIRNRGYIDLEAFFSDLPGFDVSRTYGATYSNIYQRGYRSNNTDRTLFLLDGIEENDFWGSFPYWARQYPTTNVERVEIVYGPASTMYGANAFLGVVNVITKDPFEGLTDENPVSFTTEAGFGSYNTRFAEAGVALKKKSIFLSATARGYFSDEHDLSGYEEYDYDATGFGNANKSALFEEELNGHPVEYSNVLQHVYVNTKLKTGGVLVGFQNWKSWHGSTNYGTDESRPGAKNGSVWRPEQSVTFVKYEKEFNEALSISNIAQYRVTSINDDSKIITLDSSEWRWAITYYHQKSAQFRDELRVNYASGKDLSMVGGIEVKHSLIQGDYYKMAGDQNNSEKSESNEEVTINYFVQRNLGFYLQGTYACSDVLRLTLGGRMDHNKVRDSLAYRPVFNPRVALVVTPFRKEELVFKAIYATAFQDASIRDKYSTTKTRIPNPALKPERAENFELGIGYTKGAFQIDAVAYHAFYDEVINEVKTEDDFIMNKNEGDRYVFGMQSSLAYQFAYQKHLQFQVYANYNYTLAQQDTLGSAKRFRFGKDDKTVKVDDIARHRFNLGLNALYHQKLNVNLRMNWVGKRQIQQDTTAKNNSYKLEGRSFLSYALLSGAIAYRDLIPGLDVQLVVNNLTNTEYEDPGIRSADGEERAYRTPQKGINGLIKMTYTLPQGK